MPVLHRHANHGNYLGAEETQQAIPPKWLRLAVLAVAIDRRPVLGRAVRPLPIVVPAVMVHVIMMIDDVWHADSDGFQDAVDAVEPDAREERIVNKVVRDTLQIPDVRHR